MCTCLTNVKSLHQTQFYVPHKCWSTASDDLTQLQTLPGALIACDRLAWKQSIVSVCVCVHALNLTHTSPDCDLYTDHGDDIRHTEAKDYSI